MVRTPAIVLAAVLTSCIIGHTPTATPAQPQPAAAVTPMDGNDNNDNNNGADGNTNWGTISSNKSAAPTPDPCPGGGTQTGMPLYDAVGKAGSDLGQQICKASHPGQ
jgi:hypothetical protein